MPIRKSSAIKLAAIDIGSNGIRLMLAAYSPLGLKSLKKYRVPIRLGADVFNNGRISEETLQNSAYAFRHFRQIINKHKVKWVRAVGTSALREAKNRNAFIGLIKKCSGIKVEVIDGVEEGSLIHLGVKHKIHIEHHNCLLIDIGGGSLELTFSNNGYPSATQSFPFGTVRTLDRLKKKNLSEKHLRRLIREYSETLRHFMSSQQKAKKLDFAVGTGGNMEALGRMRSELLKKKTRTFLTKAELSLIIKKLSKMSVKERIEKLDMRPDRADVIVPAAHVVLTSMQLAKLNKIIIPYVGLRDGILWSIVNKLKS